MIRYNTSTETYERYDTTGWTNIATQATVSESDDVSTGEATSIGTSAKNIDTFTTSTFDSAFYLAVMKDEINNSWTSNFWEGTSMESRKMRFVLIVTYANANAIHTSIPQRSGAVVSVLGS